MANGTYDVVMLSRSLNIPRQGAAIRNLNHECSRWSIDTHSFAWAWGESGFSLEDVVILTRLPLCGTALLDPTNLSTADQQDILELRQLGKKAQYGPIFTAQGVRKASAANTKKTSFASWIRFFFKDFQPVRTVVPGVPREFVAGPHHEGRLHMADFFAFFLSYFMFPDYPADSSSPSVFLLVVLLARGECIALAPLFLGSLHCQLDLVHADLARSLGRCDHLSMVHTSFILTYFFEHFPIIALAPHEFLASSSRSRSERWFGTNSDSLWYRACDVEESFVPRPYGTTTPGVVGLGQCLLPTRSSLFAVSGNNSMARGVINFALIGLPGWLPFVNNEAHGVSVYRPDRFVRQLSFDQGVPGSTPLVCSFVESQLRFTRPHTSDILARLGDLPIPSRDDVGRYTSGFRQFWRRNLDSFLLFIRGEAGALEVSEIRTRDTSLRAIAEVRGANWRRPHSMWVVIDVTP
ncbi:uncharacterized protein LOC131308524 [Rhododendron vialii]|uniref:uncharacterized protein LOC131308524 n=1 Tax=Rhododendron vialii TaxID=182163 RepID=UPI00265FBC1F|nr:uncharacterized protein LOC131308524 [Rhododendron vialii]